MSEWEYELNRQIDVSEVQSAIKNLKRNKSVCPSDNLLNDYFIESSDALSTHITDIFLFIFSIFIYFICSIVRSTI